jgi:radical SAM protein with 4Fe4S-binding SPASM domain
MLNPLLRAHDRWVPREHRAKLWEAYEAATWGWARLRDGRDLFTTVEVETNTDCNRRCRICPVSTGPRPSGKMSDALYTNLLGQLAAMNFRGRFSPVFYNEPLLDEKLERRMAEARRALPRSSLVVFTNGSLLTAETLVRLSDAGVDTFIVSQYARNLRADEKRAREAIERVSPRVRRKVRYRVLDDDDNLSTSGGRVPVRHPVTKSMCIQASSSCVIDWKGDVVLCCNDYTTAHTFGNVGETPLLDIWNAPRFRARRAALRAGKFELSICKACASGTLQVGA